MKIKTPEGSEIEVDEGVILNSTEVQTALKGLIDQEVAGLRTNNQKLLEDLKKQQGMMKKFEGFDLEKLNLLQLQLEKDEDLKMIAEGRHKELIEKKVSAQVEAMKRDSDATVQSLTDELQKLQSTLSAKEEALTALMVDGSVREAYQALNLEPSALDFVLPIARTVFKLEAEGKIIPRKADGTMIFGKDAKSPITPTEWLEMLTEAKPFLKRPSSGVGALGRASRPSGSAPSDPSKMSSKELIAAGVEKHFGQR